jgi:hypothetical protein
MIEIYQILQFSLPVDLENSVNDLIRRGWQPLGPPLQGRDGTLLQPMVLPRKEQLSHETL